MRSFEKYIYIYVFGIVALFILTAILNALLLPKNNIQDLLDNGFVLWIFLSPIILAGLYYLQRRRAKPINNELRTDLSETKKAIVPASSVEKSEPVAKTAIGSVIIGAISFIPPLAFFLFVPIGVYCFVTFSYFFFKKDRKNTRISFLGLLLTVAGFTVLFNLLTKP